MENKAIIVTGAASGIGKATALMLANRGANVLVADIDNNGAQEVASAVAKTKGSAEALAVDVSKESDIRTMAEFVFDRYGRLDGLVNNAADIALSFHDADIARTHMSVWDQTYQTNLRGAVVACQLTIPLMLKSPTSAIVNVSSIQSLLGDMERAAYSAMKSALNSLSRSIATAYGKKGLRCNTVCPGPVMSREPEKRWPEKIIAGFQEHILTPDIACPEDTAEIICFLLSDGARSITGQTISADCGFSSHMHFHQRAVPRKNLSIQDL